MKYLRAYVKLISMTLTQCLIKEKHEGYINTRSIQILTSENLDFMHIDGRSAISLSELHSVSTPRATEISPG